MFLDYSKTLNKKAKFVLALTTTKIHSHSDSTCIRTKKTQDIQKNISCEAKK
jgi:hypothetical protein